MLITDTSSKLVTEVERTTGLTIGPEIPNDTNVNVRSYPQTGEEVAAYVLYSKPGLLTNRTKVPLGIVHVRGVPRVLFEQ